MVRAIASETRAIVFDLTLDNLKRNLSEDLSSVKGSIFMAFKCAKEYGPAIIYIDEVEKSMPKKGAKKMEKK